MKFLVVILSAFVGLSAQAQQNPSMDCDQLMNALVAPQGATMDAKNGFKPLLSYKDGKLVVDKTNPNYKSYEKDGNKEIINFTYQNPQCPSCKVNLPKSSNGRVELTTTPEGYVVASLMDEKQMSAYAGNMQMHMLGSEASVQNQGNKTCVMDQNTMLSRFGKDGMVMRSVINDKKYCDSMKDTLRKIGKESYDKCEDVMKQANETYTARAMELAKQGKMFSPPGQGGMGMSNMSMAMWALNSCSPDEWGKNTMMGGYGYGMGMGYGMMGGSPYGVAPAKANSPKPGAQ